MTTLDVGGIHAGGAGAGGISFDLTGALAASRNLGIFAQSLPKIQQRALGTLRRRIGTEARRDIQREYRITANRLNSSLKVSSNNRSGGLRITGFWRGIGLRNFSARATGKGVTSGIFKSGKRSLRESAFFAPLLGGGEGGNRHVVKREGDKRVMTKGRYAGKTRQPVAVQYGPTAAQMLRKEGRPQRLADFAIGVLGKEMTRLIESQLRSQEKRLGVTP